MRAPRIAPLAVTALLAAAGCGESRAPENPASSMVTLPGGAADGSDVTVDGRWCTKCHGDAARSPLPTDAAGVAFAPPVDVSGATAGAKVGAHQAHLRAGNFRGAGVPCGSCHVVPATAGAHVPGVLFKGLATTSWNATPISPTYAGGSCTSTYCHGNFRDSGVSPTLAWNGAAASVTCGSCHLTPPANTAHNGITSLTQCFGCHPDTMTTGGALNLASGTHVNGQIDGGESAGGATCSTCHATIFNAMKVTSGSATRHTLALDTPTVDAVVWANPLNAVAASSRSCVNMCHGDHPHDLTSPVVSTHENNVYADATSRSTTRTSATRSPTDFNASLANGGLCTSCHVNPVDASRPAVSAAAFALSPHEGATTSDGTNTYAWGYTLHDGGVFRRNCTKCHASSAEGTTPTVAANNSGSVAVHFSANPSLLAGGTSVQNAATTLFVCWNCHGSASPAPGNQGNRSGADVQAAFGKTYLHPIATTDALHSTASEVTASWNGGQFAGANRHVACLDCHDPHAAGPTLHATGTNAVATSSPIAGTSGVAFTSPATNWTATGTGNFAWKNGVNASIAAEHELCLKCHSSFAYGATPPTGTLGASSTASETDQSLEFSTSNQSYHPVAGTLPATDPGANGSSRLAASQLCTSAVCTTASGYPAGTQNWTPGQTMYCSDCHGNDAGSAAVQGPHGSAVKFVLKGPNTCWPYTSSGTTCTATLQTLGSNPNSNAFLGGDFCKNCHPLRSNAATNDVNAWSGNRVHYEHSGPQISNVACVQCHILVPHGGKVSRLIATATGGLPARYQAAARTPTILQFVKSATPGGYTQNNCNTNCGGHAAVTNPETW